MNPILKTRLARLAANLELLARYATPRRLVNVFQNELEFFRRRDILDSYPPTVTIDITNVCQLKCPLCATGRGEVKRAKSVMPLKSFADILDQIAERSFQVHLYCWGEPTLVPGLSDYVAATRRRRLGCVIGTNLSRPLRESEALELIASGPDRIVVSLDGTTQEVHSRYRVGSDIEIVKRNVLALAAAKARLGKSRPRLIWQMLHFAHNRDQIDQARSLHREWGFDGFEVENPNLPFGSHDEKLAREWFDERAPVSRALDLKDNVGEVCFWPWRAAVIAPDGGLAACCYVHDPACDVSNVFRDGFFSAWNSPAMAAVRRAASGRGELVEPCRDCGACSSNV